MKTTLTCKLKLYTTKEQSQALRAMQIAYRNALNFVSVYAFENNKLSNQQKLHQGCYTDIREKFKLSSQLACSVSRQVSASYKSLWAKLKKNNVARKSGITKRRYKGLDKAPRYISPTITYVYGRDYGFKVNQTLSVMTLNGRILIPYTGYDKHLEYIQSGARIGESKLWYNKVKKQFYLLVSIEIESENLPLETYKHVAGVDVGIRYLAVTTTTEGKQEFYSGKKIIAKARHYERLRKRLQKKGTRSATRRLVAISGRERRLKQDANHVISARIIHQYTNSIIGLENLTDIRERTKRRKGEKASSKQRKSNAAYGKWSFSELQSYIAYKSELNHSIAIKVDAHYTSKACPICGHTDDKNRPNHGLMFICQNCGYRLHADLIGARNIAMRTLLIRQDWISTGVLSSRPSAFKNEDRDVTNVEAKAERLKRFSELRWSSVTSHQLYADGS